MIYTTDATHMAIVSFLFGFGLGAFCVMAWAWMVAAGQADAASERQRDWPRYTKLFKKA